MKRTTLAIVGLLLVFGCVANAQPNLGDGGYMGCRYPESLLKPFSKSTQPSGIAQNEQTNAWPLGVDVSTFQGTIDWDKLKTVKDFAIIRSSYGTGYTDSQFTRNRNEARRVGMLIGYYHYTYPQYNTATAEADWFLSVIGTLHVGELLMMDFEESYSDPPTWCKTFLDRIYSRTGIKPWIYLNNSQVTSYNWSSIISAGYGLSYARWDFVADPTTPTTKWGFTANKQYSDKGTGIAGVYSTYVDLDVFQGDANKWMSYGSGPLPTITLQPVSQSTCSGSSATFTVAATVTVGTLSYQWRLNGNNVSGATSTSYTTSVAGSYDCVVTGLWGPVTSNTATLDLNLPPSITTQPIGQIVPLGNTGTFTVVAAGPSLSYQWRRNGANISGAISSTYTTGSPGNYSCVVSNSCGSVTSSNVGLVISGATFVPSVVAAKQLTDGTVVAISQGPVVTRAFGTSFFYVEDFNRVTGVRVIPNGSSNMLAEGWTATIYGTLQTIAGERVLNNAVLNNMSTTTAVNVLGMTCDSAVLPMSQGLFVRMCGVASVAHGATDTFTLSDGSYSALNVKLYGVALPADGAHINVRGVLGQEAPGLVLRVNKSTDLW